MKYHIVTFGCAANVADSERIAGNYKARGYKKAKSMRDADCIIINTCMVRQSAEDRVYGLVNNLSKIKSSFGRKIIVTGCMAGMALRDKTGRLLRILKKKMPEVDEFLPIEEVGLEYPQLRKSPTHALIPISNGCNNFCTYCVVPFSRGREVSRPFEEIVRECKTLVKNGYTHITLVGQNVNSYGTDIINTNSKPRSRNLKTKNKLKPTYVKHLGRLRIPTLFPQLLDVVANIKGVKKVDFISSNPWDFSNRLIEVIKRNKNISRTIHLPVQSGDNEILKKMNRWYTRSEYLKLVANLKSKIPSASLRAGKNLKLSTDIIVGFPGETEKQFENTVLLCKKVGFSKAYISKYSDRPMTAAHISYKDDIPYKEKTRRWRILEKMINRKNMIVNKSDSKS